MEGLRSALFLPPVFISVSILFCLVHFISTAEATVISASLASNTAATMADGTPPGYIGDEKMPALDDGSHEDAADPGEDIYQSVDPLDPRKVSLDIFEMYCHEMVNTPTIGRKAYLIIQMRVSFLLHSFDEFSPAMHFSDTHHY